MTTKDLSLDELLDQAFSLRNEAGLLFNSSEYLLEAAELFNEALSNYDLLYTSLQSVPIYGDVVKINREHIRYEKYNCLFIYYHRNYKFKESLNYFELANHHIKQALELISILEPTTTGKLKVNLDYDKNRWTYYSIQLNSQYYFVLGDFEKSKNNFTNSLDNYKRSIDELLLLMDKVKLYLPYLEPHYERLVLANYEMVFSNYALVKSLTLSSIEKSSKLYGTMLVESIIELWNAYVHSVNSIREFPEYDLNKIVAENQLTKINKILSENKNYWPQVIAKMNQDLYFIENLKTIDLKKYNKSQNNEEHNKMKKYILSGVFVIFSIIIIFALLATINKHLTLLQFFLMSGVGIILLIILSAVQLKVSDQIKEENFMKLIQFALNKYFKDFKSIIKYFKK